MQGWEMDGGGDGQMLPRCVRSPFQLLLTRTASLAAEVDVAELQSRAVRRPSAGCAS